MWKKEALLFVAVMGIIMTAAGIASLIPKPVQAQANPDLLVYVGKTPIGDTQEFLYQYRGRNGTMCVTLVTERVVKTAQHISCVRN
ncbi:MAG: hypothetical protein KBE09_00560 [Candidatus Pacebacteria bacterium]|nr:hypothetical protein [Candidatus Paceibacterota bacterium]